MLCEIGFYAALLTGIILLFIGLIAIIKKRWDNISGDVSVLGIKVKGPVSIILTVLGVVSIIAATKINCTQSQPHSGDTGQTAASRLAPQIEVGADMEDSIVACHYSSFDYNFLLSLKTVQFEFYDNIIYADHLCLNNCDSSSPRTTEYSLRFDGNILKVERRGSVTRLEKVYSLKEYKGDSSRYGQVYVTPNNEFIIISKEDCVTILTYTSSKTYYDDKNVSF